MKFKKITQKVLPVIFSLVLAVGTAITGAGATEEKTYLKEMDYPHIETNLKEDEYDEYSFTEFEGKFQKIDELIECTNAMRLWFDDDNNSYITDSSSPLYKGNFASYKITYTLAGEYDEFCADIFTNSPKKIDCEIIGDGRRLKMHSITESSEMINLKINVEDINTLDINISSPFGAEYIGRAVIFNNAYLTTGEVKEKPTDPTVEPATDPKEEPTVEPATDPKEEPTVEPATDPKEEPTVEPITDPKEEPTTEPTDPTDIPNPTNPTDNPTKPTTPTDNPTNKPNSNIITNNTTTGKTAGTVNTGDTSFIFVALMVIGVAGIVTFIVRKVKYSK